MTLLISKLNPTGRSRSRHNPHENCNSQMYRSSVPKSSTRASTSSITSLKTSPRSTRSSPRNRSSSGSKNDPNSLSPPAEQIRTKSPSSIRSGSRLIFRWPPLPSTTAWSSAIASIRSICSSIPEEKELRDGTHEKPGANLPNNLRESKQASRRQRRRRDEFDSESFAFV
uniref:(northern house mosquito) hypothetical protein n=1 Tax=Culex pipiens TaxID=7175 RepID=A0A8D8HH67_CULPI